MKLTVSLLGFALFGASVCLTDVGLLRHAAGQDAPPPEPTFDAPATPKDDLPPPVPAEEIEVLTRGPVHEAFATPVIFDPKPGLKITEPPPAPIEELPPDAKPVGDNVAWISGYWSWDDERDRFIWISGIWRAVPPDLEWVPGYWFDDKAGHFQWVAGFWKKDDDDDISYLPPPPETVEEGPVGQQTSENQSWVPGTWMWRDGRYVWRPGYWVDCHQGWLWVPSSYVWTPNGYIFVRGYWDYPLNRRGMMFAPICPVNTGRFAWSYSPTVVIDSGVCTSYLFVNRSTSRYYYGDYYGPSYRTSGYMPWFSFHSSRFGHDPLYAHSQWQHRHDANWGRHLRNDFDRYENNVNDRPARRFTATDVGLAAGAGALGGAALATTLQKVASRDDRHQHFQAVPTARRDQFRANSNDLRKVQAQRVEAERAIKPIDAAVPGQPGRSEHRTVKLPKSPVTAKKVEANSQLIGPVQSGKLPAGVPLVNPGATPTKPVEVGKPVIPGTPSVTGQPDPRSPRPNNSERPGKRGDQFNPKLDSIINAPKSQPQPVPQPQPTVQPQPKPAVPVPTVPVVPQPSVQPKPQPQPQPVVPQQPKVQPIPQPTPKPQPQPVLPPAPKVQPQPAPQPQPVVPQAPKVQPQPAPRPQPQPVVPQAPKVQPQSAPRPQPVVPQAPKVQPQPAPRPQPQPAPKPQPNPPATKVPGKKN